MRVFEYSIKILGNQVIDQILEFSNTRKNLIYIVLSTKKTLFQSGVYSNNCWIQI